MAKAVATLVKVSSVLVGGGLLLATTLVSNCGGSSGERTGAGGSTGQGGSGGAPTIYTCSPGPALDCSEAATLKLPDGKVTDFSTAEWSNTAGKYCNAAGLRGSIFSYSGPTAPDNAATVSVDYQNTKSFVPHLTVASGGYAGAGLSMDTCVDASAFNAMQFTASVMGGTIDGCVWQVHLQTQEQRPSNRSSPNGGLCDPDAGTCDNYPAVMALPLPTASVMTITAPFAQLAPDSVMVPTIKQIVGMQWQIQSGPPADPDGGVQPGCDVTLSIDDIKFVTAP